MKHVIQRFLHWKTSYEPLVNILIHKDAILHNLAQFQTLIGDRKIVPVLKSNAYGHGLNQVAKFLDPLHMPFIALDSFYEALTLRREGIKTPILIIGYSYPDNIVKNNLRDISFAITNSDSLKEIILSSTKQRIKIQLKVDTGMRRQGVLQNEIKEIAEIIHRNKQIELEGVFTHLSDADSDDHSFTNNQIKEWNEVVSFFRKEFPNIKYFHASASAGHAFSDEIDSNIFRLGLGLYGISPSKEISAKIHLRPALEMRTVITGIKTVRRGEKIGYNGTFTAETDMTVATIPVGYNEGVDRRLSNKGFVKIRNEFAPIVGRVSMNIITIDISNISNIHTKDEVVVFSHHKTDKNCITEVAKDCGTIPYEILVHIPQHLRRTLI